MSLYYFYLCAGIVALSACSVVLTSKPAYALLSLIVTMCALSLLYLDLGGPFVAMINLIVYAGAVLVLFLFVIMMQGVGSKDVPLKDRFHPLLIPSALILSAVFLSGWFTLLGRFPAISFQNFSANARAVGHIIFTRFVLPFELISILLILAIFAAVALAKQEDRHA